MPLCCKCLYLLICLTVAQYEDDDGSSGEETLLSVLPASLSAADGGAELLEDFNGGEDISAPFDAFKEAPYSPLLPMSADVSLPLFSSADSPLGQAEAALIGSEPVDLSVDVAEKQVDNSTGTVIWLHALPPTPVTCLVTCHNSLNRVSYNGSPITLNIGGLNITDWDIRKKDWSITKQFTFYPAPGGTLEITCGEALFSFASCTTNALLISCDNHWYNTFRHWSAKPMVRGTSQNLTIEYTYSDPTADDEVHQDYSHLSTSICQSLSSITMNGLPDGRVPASMWSPHAAVAAFKVIST